MIKLCAFTAGVLLTGIGLSGCSSAANEPRTLLVPDKFTTIQQAVDEAKPGDLVLISPGTYHESVKIDRDEIVVRGIDRNEVIIDGRDDLINGFEISADSVAIENLTVKSFRQNGVVFSGALRELKGGYGVYGSESNTLDGYRVSYVTTYNNGL
jgi:pectin methylesterase-like acyl-CoA thioesterase